MLRTFALSDLFSANLDSVVEGIFLSTTSGSLIGLSPQLPPSLCKRLSVLGALTWRFHWNSIRNRHSSRVVSGTSTTSSASSPGGLAMAAPQPQVNGAAGPRVRLGIERTQPLPVLRTVVAEDGAGLQELTVQCNDRLCSFEYVKEGLIVGTVSKTLGGEDRREEGSEENGNHHDDTSTAGSEDDDAEQEQHQNGSVENAGENVESTAQRERLVRLLALKASAMAEHLRDELKDFKMPSGLE